MNNPNPFVPQGSLLEQKNKARKRLKLAVFFTLSIGVVGLMALLIQGCRKPQEPDQQPAEQSNPPPPSFETPSNPPETNLPPDTNPPPVVAAPVPPPPITPPVTPTAPVAGQEYTIVRGDTFAGLAKKFTVSVRAIQDANPNVDPRKLKIGQKIQIPAPAGGASVSAPMAAVPESANMTGVTTYKVKSGDTLTRIARRFGTTIKAIESANNLTTTRIRVGQALKVPAKAAPPAAMPEPAPAPAPAPTAAPMSAPAPASAPGSPTM